ncbi:DUF6445 family protein [Sphingomonas sp.]|jgi:hypothetical protein|uniref:DUF6445 family protein n=1 Tax=Sphingomonas sp. TaxID=28214 RepID=UPI002ED9CECC
MTLLNPHAAVRVEHQGSEAQPVIVIDDMLAAPERWRDLAAQAAYRQIGPHYPGLRALVPAAAAIEMRVELAALIGDTFALAPVPQVFECYFSIVTTPPEALAPIQRLPHVDGLEPDRLAILIYLSGADQGGTAFYRQRKTGFETVDAARFPAFDAALRTGVAEHGLPPAAYIAGDTPLYEQIAAYEARPNRALIYRSHALHCAHIAAGTLLPADPQTGRLSINSFLFDPPR